jgi:flagellar hook-length control protein FliK
MPRFEAPRHVTAQVAEAARMLSNGPVELALSPEELGRVKMTLSATEGGMTLVVTAERPETLDLLRRNIDLLAQDFREMGYESLEFSFGQERRSPDAFAHEAGSGGGDGEAGAAGETERLAQPRRSMTITGAGLDLRL